MTPLKRSWVCVAGLVFLLAAGVMAQQTIWVSSPASSLKAENSALAQTVSEVPIGTKLNVLNFDGQWYQVTTDSGQKGWIYRGKISETPPTAGTQGEENALGGLLSGLSGSSIEADDSDTSRSIRGLSPEAQEYAKQTGTPEQYQKALDNMLKINIHQKRIEQFLQNGKIGEFAK